MHSLIGLKKKHLEYLKIKIIRCFISLVPIRWIPKAQHYCCETGDLLCDWLNPNPLQFVEQSPTLIGELLVRLVSVEMENQSWMVVPQGQLLLVEKTNPLLLVETLSLVEVKFTVIGRSDQWCKEPQPCLVKMESVPESKRRRHRSRWTPKHAEEVRCKRKTKTEKKRSQILVEKKKRLHGKFPGSNSLSMQQKRPLNANFIKTAHKFHNNSTA